MSEHQKSENISITSTTGPKLSIISVVCRICYDSEKEEELINPCHCKGTVAFVHRSCLETWLGESNTTTCELCHQVFRTERTPKYSSYESIWRWCWSSPRSQHGVRSDIIACTIITPLAIIITYVCLFSSEYYNQKKFTNVPAARWTSVSLLIMIGIMLIGYYMWVYSVIRLHARMWYSWWQRTCDVRYIPPSTISIDIPDTSPNSAGHVNTPNTLNESQNETEINVSAMNNNPEQRSATVNTNTSGHTIIDLTDYSDESVV